jgi:cyclic beta-1,2-glucan synthetase
VRCHPTAAYLGVIALLSCFILALLLGYGLASGASAPILGLLALIVIVPSVSLAVSLMNLDVTSRVIPRTLPKIDTSRGIPDNACTFVVIPTLLTGEQSVAEMIESLEVRYLANQDDNLYFALLGDFADAPAEHMAGDDALLEAALAGVADLNARYPSEGAARFHLFHRRRQWNGGEKKWMGWERKRGKLHEFNRLVRNISDTSFIVATAPRNLLSRIRYVITLDSDTQLPRDAARRLVGAILHPLNQPCLDKRTGLVTRGYAILQPRVSMSLVSASQSHFARIFSGHTGIDPYTTAVSDIYQDLFNEGIYTGKGLYAVDAFEDALYDRVPEDSLLSHDLFEGLYARTALATDIELLDDYPAYYDSYAKRQHRWTRGDWQVLPWLFPHVRDAESRKVRNVLPLIARWKILDNLLRSLLAPSLVAWLLAAWTLLPGMPALWTLAAIFTIAFPVYAHVTNSLLLHPRGIPWTSHFWSVWGDVVTNTLQIGLTIIFLAHQAYLQTDAIARTLYRVFISRKRLLEWVTAAQAERTSAHDLGSFLSFMWPAELIAVIAAASAAALRPESLPVCLPFVVLWSASPFVAYYASRRLLPAKQAVRREDARFVRLIARRTWRFFETFAGEEDNWLVPDNYQETPAPVVAHRTSPTNMGLLLLSTVAARDLGYVGTLELIERLELTLATMSRLERFRGHYLNWYDTRTLEPLSPRYVSTVDSGNLVGHLPAIKQALIEVADDPLFGPRIVEGLADTILLMREEGGRLAGIRQSTGAVTLSHLREEMDRSLRLVAEGCPVTLTGWSRLFESLTFRLVEIEDMLDALSHEHGREPFEKVRFWINALMHQLREYRRDLVTLCPWASVLAPHVAGKIRERSEEAARHWDELISPVDRVFTLSELPEACEQTLDKLYRLRSEIERGGGGGDDTLKSIDVLRTAIEDAREAATGLLARAADIARTADRTIEEMDFRFLFDEERKVFIIGYNVTEGRADNSFYDLLASESRLASFIAIAKGDVPQEHWFHLGRQLASATNGRALISWTATMFEYLMPLLVMRSYDGTLLDETHHAVVARQIEYGKERGVPWGVSESAYNARDLNLNYQYGPFGIPGLGLKRGLGDDLVVSPYSSMLAGIIDVRAAVENLKRLARDGALTRFGFYEAIDYTPERLPENHKRVIIHAFMAHHQGMSLVALDNLINDNVMQDRFHADPLVRATEMLLQERVPRHIRLVRPRAEEVMASRDRQAVAVPVTRRFDSADLPTPRTQLLSNGTYSVVVTTAGSGYSICGGIALTRWREDVTRDNWGSFIYLRDVRSGAVWSAGYQPATTAPRDYEVYFSESKAEFRREDAGIATHTEVIVSHEDHMEVRRVTVINNSSRDRTIELTSYAEVVLAPPAADAAHPTFSNLFIETEFFAAESALLARRRPRSEKEDELWGLHVITTEGEKIGEIQFETDRARFIGRGHTTANPIAITEGRPLSNTSGAVLDPIFSLRRRVRIAPGEMASVSFATGFARTREEALALADKYHNVHTFEREADLAWVKSQVEMRHLNIDADEAHLFQRLAGRLLYCDPSLRPRPHVLELNSKTQSGLWSYGISGDLPVALVRISEEKDLATVRRLLHGHEYLRYKGLAFDLVILNDHPTSYLQALQDELQRLVRASGSQSLIDKPGGVYIRQSDLIPEADRILLHTVARVVIVTDRGPLEEQLVRRPVESVLPPPLIPRLALPSYPEPRLKVPELSFFNGLGGFFQGGREYVTVLNEGQWTPAPWLNVVSNAKDFGFQISETGSGYTWSINSRENRLTPWSNDPVSDAVGECIYIRDEATGEVWTPTPLPVRESETYIIRHGQGYSIFEHESHNITQHLATFVPADAPVKISILTLTNRTDRKRSLSVTSYAEWVLGLHRGASAQYVITWIDETGALFARNSYNNEFAGRVAFADTSEAERSVTGDRKEFLGRNGSLDQPDALGRAGLSGRTGAGLDPCAAIKVAVSLAPGETRQIVVLLGEAETEDEARRITLKYRDPETARRAYDEAVAYWDDLLSAVQVKTPDAAMDVMLNRWLLYQTLACRVWARSAFYQSGGAYGFRDQLQDVCALVYSKPDIARAHIIRAAAHQFKEGDVQHWWHPPTGRGVRTRFSDDLLWLPFVTAFYINVTGDETVLDEVVPFLEAPLLEPGEHESYTQPSSSAESATIYEHCARTLDRSLEVGPHSLPLIGSGDWNDGMNRVGHEGRGESIWVGWFLHMTLRNFVKFSEKRGEDSRAASYHRHMKSLKEAIEEHGWDGYWYRRAYFDNGTPLGSAQNEECKIDSIAQSWGVISGAADPHRVRRAMAAVEEYLIRRGDGLVILFTPPFDRGELDPGYIKGYLPGVRENGGQYTHAAIWTLIAFAMLGDGDKAGELFSLLNPVGHASTRSGLHKYKVEPYVAAADIYAVWPHTGRGGWTWYTGSAGWMYRAGLESILGFQLRGDKLEIDPCVPRWWREYEITYRHGSTRYHIRVENPHGINRGLVEVELDGRLLQGVEIPLSDDHIPHKVRVVLGERAGAKRLEPEEATETDSTVLPTA